MKLNNIAAYHADDLNGFFRRSGQEEKDSYPKQIAGSSPVC